MDQSPVTALLHDWRKGNKDAGRELFAQLQPELRKIAGKYMRRETPGRTLQATALVNELYLRLMGGNTVEWQDRAHFMAVASQQLRRILVAAAMIFPLGFFLGMPFPLGILALRHQPRGAIAWAWGLNGIFTLLGGLASVMMSIFFGFRLTLLVAAAIYIVALCCFARMRANRSIRAW